MDQFLGDISDLGLTAVLVGVDAVLLDGVVLNQGRVVKFTCLFNLSLAKLEELCVEARFVLLEDLKRNFCAIGLECFLYFGAEALPEGAAESEVVDCC